MPVDSVTSVMFGGADLDILYVTSMARPFQGRRRQEREAGGLFAVILANIVAFFLMRAVGKNLD